MRGYCLWSYGELWFELTSTCAFLAGGFAGATSRTVVSPLERLKIIQYVLFVQLDSLFVFDWDPFRQVQPRGSNSSYNGVWNSLVRMWREEGFRGFMRGNGINCLRIVPYRYVLYYVFFSFVCYIDPESYLLSVRYNSLRMNR